MRATRSTTILLAVLGLAALAAQNPDAAKVDQGRQLFEKNRCLLCHKLADTGGTLSVALDGVGSRVDAKKMRLILTDPDEALKDSTAKVKMPRFPLKDEEIDALVAYLLTLREPAGR